MMSATTKDTKDTKKELPPGWRWVKLGEVCEVNPRRPQIECANEKPTSFVPMEAVDAITGTIADLRTRPYGEVKKGYTWFVEDDVLFAKITPCMQNGKHAIAHGLIDGFGFGTTEFHVLRPGPHIVAEWIWNYLRQPVFLIDAIEEFTGSVGQQRLPADYLKSHEIPLPPLAEQRRIAGILKEQLAAVDKARAAAEARLEAVKALPTAFLRHIFGVNPVLTASPVTPKKPITSGWKWHRLTDLARLATGHTPSRYHDEYWKGTVPWLQLADIRVLDGHEAQDTAEHTNELGLANSSSVLLPKDTVCMSRTASVGFFTVMGRPMCTSQDFVNWVCSDALAPWFLLYLLSASRENIRDLGSGAIHKTIYLPTVRNFSVCIPALQEQHRLAALLREQITTAEKTRAAAEQELAAINALPAALLRRAFTGGL